MEPARTTGKVILSDIVRKDLAYTKSSAQAEALVVLTWNQEIVIISDSVEIRHALLL